MFAVPPAEAKAALDAPSLGILGALHVVPSELLTATEAGAGAS